VEHQEEEEEDLVNPRKIYIVVGASHAGRIAEELEEKGEKVRNLSRAGWRPTRENVQLSTAELRQVIREEEGRDICVIYQLMDNSVFLSQKDGRETLPVRLEDGHHHVVGKLVFIDSDGFKDLLHNVLPLLKASDNYRKIIISPVQRYVAGPCCPNPDHVTNFADPAYAGDMAAGLKELRESLRSFVYKRNVKNFRVVSGEKLLGWEEGVSASTLKALWGRDPVHLATAGYRVMAETLRDMFSSEAPFVRSVNVQDETKTRADWIRNHEAAASCVRGGGGLSQQWEVTSKSRVLRREGYFLAATIITLKKNHLFLG